MVEGFISEVRFDSLEHTRIRDITDEINNAIKKSNVTTGRALINSLHTTLVLKVTETREPNLFKDIEHFLISIIPEDWRSFNAGDLASKGYELSNDYLHRCQDNPLSDGKDIGYNAASHLRALFFQTSIDKPIEDGRLKLGTFQGIAAVELDGRDGRDGNEIRKRVIQVRIYPSGPLIYLDE